MSVNFQRRTGAVNAHVGGGQPTEGCIVGMQRVGDSAAAVCAHADANCGCNLSILTGQDTSTAGTQAWTWDTH